MTIRIITDGSCDLPASLTERLGISVVPLTVRIDSEEMDSSVDTEYFYRRMKEAAELPQTSSPNPHTFLSHFRAAGTRDMLVLCLSSALSSTYRHAEMAKEMFVEEGFEGRIEVLDAKTTSLGLGVLAVRAAKLAQERTSFSDLYQSMVQRIKDTRTEFTLDTLENVIKGGRLDRVRGAVASFLNIKLLMQASGEGTIEVVDKVRGSQNAMKRLLDKIGETFPATGSDLIGIAHSNCEEKAKAFAKQVLDRYPFRDVVFSNMGPVIGTYAGEGGLLVAY
ncbi:hypothetical protein J31TS4_15390 [Paenibacillus sp. J31TS4]|uniref:DegV family protein n=1 Tax=Paenibacillus sp. J31TS4 TaxID=2807195 RepID=UPI001B0F3505|nr:DegV family protein [Paenibacillus sp. J31TS4]GIP38259.1 hypothetical protein J31TS4_15390 [Paenibacillus sp. J31TS4]